jgi:hypothetical protein
MVYSPIWDPRPDFCFCQAVLNVLMCGTLCDKWMGLLFTIGAPPGTCSHSWFRVLRDLWSYSLFTDLRIPTWRARSLSPRNKVTQLYPQALSALYIASYNLKGCGVGFRTRLHTGELLTWLTYITLTQHRKHHIHWFVPPLLLAYPLPWELA